MYLFVAEMFRQQDIDEHRNRPGQSLCSGTCQPTCNECAHVHFHRIVRETREGLEAVAPKDKMTGIITKIGERECSKGYGLIRLNDKVLYPFCIRSPQLRLEVSCSPNSLC
jgi:hypothetical protein